jgi:hypothetical protein
MVNYADPETTGTFPINVCCKQLVLSAPGRLVEIAYFPLSLPGHCKDEPSCGRTAASFARGTNGFSQ